MVFVGGHMMGGGFRGGGGGGYRGDTAGSVGHIHVGGEKYPCMWVVLVAILFVVVHMVVSEISRSVTVAIVCNLVLLGVCLITAATLHWKKTRKEKTITPKKNGKEKTIAPKKTWKENTIAPAVDEELTDDVETITLPDEDSYVKNWLQLLKPAFQHDIRLLTQLFNSYDKDQDGFLDEDEMRSLLADLATTAKARLGELQQQLRGAMKAEQAQGNPEWGTLLMYRGVTTSLKSLGNVPDNQMNTQEIVRKRFDISKDGKISKEEFIVRAPIVAQELCDPIPEVD